VVHELYTVRKLVVIKESNVHAHPLESRSFQFIQIQIHQGLEIFQLKIYTRIWLKLWSSKIDKILRKFGLRKNYMYSYKENWVRCTQTQLRLPLSTDSIRGGGSDEVINAVVQVINCMNVKPKSEKSLGFLK
jgi:hypothetical protein